MNYFIKNIKVNKLFHLNDFNIPIEDEGYPHLIITGKNGSGKTILLQAVADFLNQIRGANPDFLLIYTADEVKRSELLKLNQENEQSLLKLQKKAEELCRKVEMGFTDSFVTCEKYLVQEDFIMAFYQAYRKSEMTEPKNPTKPSYNKKGRLEKTATSQFLNFLSDLKIQEALARNAKQDADADEIGKWFTNFEELLQKIYQDKDLKLEFNYKDYSFRICTEDKKFKFTEMADGFAAILEIVADLILKMQEENSLTRNYQKEGIVLIDEIETHLHLGLQKIIMPLLTTVFPNVQFIITTHSPFVLSSLNNAVAYDLEHRKLLNDLTEYSYEALAEGYFGVNTESSYVQMQLDTLRTLLEKKDHSDSDTVTIKQLLTDFEKIPETVSPLAVGAYRQLVTKYSDKITGLHDKGI